MILATPIDIDRIKKYKIVTIKQLSFAALIDIDLIKNDKTVTIKNTIKQLSFCRYN